MLQLNTTDLKVGDESHLVCCTQFNAVLHFTLVSLFDVSLVSGCSRSLNDP